MGQPEPKPWVAKLVIAALALWAVSQAALIITFDGTYDAGDSALHYLYARYAFEHPAHLLNHWAKPIFTFLAAPAAQLGWAGMKAFQCILALVAAWVAFRSASTQNGKAAHLAWTAPLFLLFAPEYFLAQFSGLTEILFGTLLLCGVVALLRRNLLSGAAILALLPLVRTEGMIVLLVFGAWMLLRRQWVPFLVLGWALVLYSLLGAVFLGDFFWIFTQNPYDHGFENYGSGTWGHYFEQYPFIVGIPIMGLTCLGVVAGGLKLAGRNADGRKFGERLDRWWLLYLPFYAYFLSHVFFWATGTGHSLGMARVMLALVPLGALIALEGLALLWALLPEAWGRARWVLPGLVAAYIAVFPFSGNPAGLKLPRDLELQPDQALAKSAVAWLEGQGTLPKPLYVSHPSLAMFAGLDPFDSTDVQTLRPLLKGVPQGSILVWDSWFSVKEDGCEANYWEVEANLYSLLWKKDTLDGKSQSEMRIYRRK